MRCVVPALDNILGEHFKVLDKGFIRVIDYMGGDSSIVQAARVSYGEGTKHVSKDSGLINYLMKNNHTSPFEMCEIKLHIKLPVFVARQWIRHRTANVNEYSGRYSIMSDDYYIPSKGNICFQSNDNKQGRGNTIDDSLSDEFLKDLISVSEKSKSIYTKYLDSNVSREIARFFLPVNFYTEWYWKIDLHNLFHFLRLRCDNHAQFEIREYANTILNNIVKSWVPISYSAFCKHKINSISLSCDQSLILKKRIKGLPVVDQVNKISARELNYLEDYFEEKF
ncbi:FAD-dependent thymidylate synthase [Anaplasmataceae bacterium AB001_6]|nr:FAD-dependent thymidylate synthase [Anaplasmataceae bacterium AB001_6]